MPARILLIEDNPANLELMRYLLSAFGYAPLVAMTGEDGLETARRELPDLIICDVQLPLLDGYEVARKMGLIFDADGAITEGNQILYRDRLKFPHVEFRNVFTLDTKMNGLYKQFQMKFRRLSGR